MQRLHKLGLVSIILTALPVFTACGAVQAADTMLMGSPAEEGKKTRCPGEHEGFYVCLDADSNISNQALETSIATALSRLATLVNSDAFASKIEAAFSNGGSIMNDLRSTNYIVDIDSYCNAGDDALAKATLGGSSILYNQCKIATDSNGQIELAAVAGVLLHEISHNVGYTHPDINPSRATVPYFLGDTAEASLGDSGISYSNQPRNHHGYGY